jgi:acyl-CoA synthetase (AMP-forming)/AMP-acid ligase II
VTATTAPPALLAGLLGGKRILTRRLETMEQLDIAGSHLPSQLARDARFYLTPNLWISYGTSETGRIATADAALCIEDPSAVGYLGPWTESEIVDAADRPLPAGHEGALRIRTDEMSAGYYRNPAATSRNFRGGWFYPGDIGAITADGLLRITARIEDVIRHGGTVASPLPLEEVFRGLPGVRDVAVFPLVAPDGGEEICAALVLDRGASADAIQVGARAQLGDRAPTRLFQVEALPRNEAGKVLRRELVQWALRSAAS